MYKGPSAVYPLENYYFFFFELRETQNQQMKLVFLSVPAVLWHLHTQTQRIA